MTTVKERKTKLCKEKKQLNKFKRILKNNQDKDEIDYNNFKLLYEQYKKILTQFEYLLSISDNYQLDMIQTREKLKKEIKEKNHKEKKLKEKIEELEKVKDELETKKNKLTKISTRDQLTGLYNRREFEKVIKKEWRSAIRNAEPISLIMIDIDNFKNFNDNYGHLAGDNCLQQLSGVLKNSLKRPRDFVARYGGEEFVVILPSTDLEGAEQVAENLRKNVVDHHIPHKYSPVEDYVTISLGIAVTTEPDLYIFEEILDKADQALYQAKDEGKNRYSIYEL
ncbi:MAG: GGDEF domain-containing protein [Halanaerobiales bacterium]